MNVPVAHFRNQITLARRLMWVAAAASGLTTLAIRFLKGHVGLAVVRHLLVLLFRLSPPMMLLSSLRVLEWTGGNSSPRLASSECEADFRWLVARLQELPPKRKAQLCTLAWSQILRSAERAIANHREHLLGRPLTRLRWLIVATSDTCNLRCNGCYAKPVWGHWHVPFTRLEYIASEAERIGVETLIVVGWGEPFYNAEDKMNLFRLARRHRGITFSVFTNATLVSEEDAAAMDCLGNLLLLLSLDGWEHTNDARRGRGVFQRVARTAQTLRKRQMLFGISVTVTSGNYREVTSAEFVDTMRSWGAMWVLYLRFSSYPLHSEGSSLVLSPAQLAEFSELLASARKRQPMPLVDSDETEMRLGGCQAQQGKLAFVDAVTGRVSGCIKLPLAPASHNLFDNPIPGRLSELLHSNYFGQFWKQFPTGWRCSEGCQILSQTWKSAFTPHVRAFPVFPENEQRKQ